MMRTLPGCSRIVSRPNSRMTRVAMSVSSSSIVSRPYSRMARVAMFMSSSTRISSKLSPCSNMALKDEIENHFILLERSPPAAAELSSCYYTKEHGDLLERNAETLYNAVRNSYNKVSHFEGLHYYCKSVSDFTMDHARCIAASINPHFLIGFEPVGTSENHRRQKPRHSLYLSLTKSIQINIFSFTSSSLSPL